MENKVKCSRCHVEMESFEVRGILYSKKAYMVLLCPSCMTFISGLINASINDIIEEYILRKE